MRRTDFWTLLLLLLGGATACLGGDREPVSPVKRGRMPVIGGSASVDELGFEISIAQQNAIVDGDWCTGTIVGDRAVVLAGHCVIFNNEEWFYEGEDPLVAASVYFDFVVGPDIEEPLCDVLDAEEVYLNPAIEPDVENLRTHQDVAVIVLRQSVFESCPEVVPIQINRDSLREDLLGAEALLGGYGSLDGSSNFSPLRYWALLELIIIRDDDIVLDSTGQGFPTSGDSGAPALLRFPDGSLRHLGVVSGREGVTAPGMRFIRLDAHVDFLDEVLDESLVCGPVDEEGICRANTVVRCSDGWLHIEECAPQSLSCTEEDGQAECRCTCDEESYCEEGCECDPGCACGCDTSDSCDADCDCDPNCTCGCDTSDSCDADCDCDPGCVGAEADAGVTDAAIDGSGEDAGDDRAGGGCSTAGAVSSSSVRRLARFLVGDYD